MKSDIFLRQWWNDPRLDVGQRVFNFNIDPSQYFWVPDTFISNARKTESHQTLTKNSLTTLGPNSSVYASMRQVGFLISILIVFGCCDNIYSGR